MKITRRQFVQAMAVAGASALLTACGGSSGSTAGSGAASAAAGGSFNLKLGHNLAEDHAVHIQLTSFAEQVKEKTGGSINIQIIPNGTLGSEADMISQIQAGALDMAKVSASTLGNFSEKYNAFSVPYVFNDQAHYYSYMDSDSAKAVFESTDDQGFRGLTWLDSGARSFYTKATAIRTPADLKGLKIRTMDSQMAIDMMNCLGGSATVMGYSDIYTGMQQGVIDGAENNVTALRDHGDVTKYPHPRYGDHRFQRVEQVLRRAEVHRGRVRCYRYRGVQGRLEEVRGRGAGQGCEPERRRAGQGCGHRRIPGRCAAHLRQPQDL